MKRFHPAGRNQFPVDKGFVEDNEYVFLHGLAENLWLMSDTSPKKMVYSKICNTEKVGVLILEENTPLKQIPTNIKAERIY